MQTRRWFMPLLAVFVAVVVGYVDTHTRTDDNLPMALILIVCAFCFGFAQPQRAWLWALIIGLGVPVAHLTGLLFGYRPPYPVEPSVMATFIALLPALVGAYMGVLTGFAARALKAAWS